MDVRSREFQERFIADLEQNQRPTVLEIDSSTALCLIAQIQLALRHPSNTGNSARQARQIIEQLIDIIAVTPVLRRGLEAGFDPECDVQR